MSPMTLQLDGVTQTLLHDALRAPGVAPSAWLANVIRRDAGQAWPAECLVLAGSFADFRLRADSHPTYGQA